MLKNEVQAVCWDRGVERSKIQKGKVYGGTLPFLMHAQL